MANNMDNGIENEIWNVQIGKNQQIGHDFSGRIINKKDFENSESEYGWSLIDFGNDEYLVAHLNSKKEFPKNITSYPGKEFIVNGKIFSVSQNENNEWDINLIEYKNVSSSDNYENNKLDLNDKDNKIQKEYEYKEDNFNERKNILIDKIDVDEEDKKTQEILSQQENEIQLLEKELISKKRNIRQSKIDENNKKLNKLREELNKTNSFDIDHSYDLYKENNDYNYDINKELDSTLMFQNQIYPKKENNIIENLTKKLNDQTLQLEKLKLDEKINKMKLDAMNNFNQANDFLFDEMFDNKNANKEIAYKLWNKNYGDSNYATDFAGKIISKDKYNENSDGGWSIDYYDKNDLNSAYISSIECILKRNGKKSFFIDNIEYFVNNYNGVWEMDKSLDSGIKYSYSSKNISNIASRIKPKENEIFNGKYETYSSLLINLEHFPLIHLNKFEEFLNKTLRSCSIFKDMFIYSNERLYRNNQSNISAYARIFFKTSSTKGEIEVLMISISLRKGMFRFLGNFLGIGENNISFSMFLYNHQKRLKFVHAQTNFELLRAHPIPLRIPKNTLIIDSEFNSILKFHENNLWKKLKPYSLDHNGNVYYICDIDFDSIDVNFSPTMKNM